MFTIDQIASAQKAQMDAINKFSAGLFDSADELFAQNVKAGKAMMSQATAGIKSLPQAGQFNDFMSKQAELMRPFLNQVRSFNAKASDAMDAAGEYLTPSKPVRAAAKQAK